MPGVDSIFVGPGDLSASMGHIGDIGNPERAGEARFAAAACRKLGKPCGIVGATPEMVAKFLEYGYSWVAIGSDMSLMVGRAQEYLGKVRGVAAAAPASQSSIDRRASDLRGDDDRRAVPGRGRGASRARAGSRRRHRGIHVSAMSTCCARRRRGARGGRCPRARVLSARALFEPHRACAARVRGPRHPRSHGTSATIRIRSMASAGSGPGASSRATRRSRAARARSHGRRAPRRARGRGRFRATQWFGLQTDDARRDAHRASSRIANTGDAAISVRPRVSSVLPANGDDRARFRRGLRLGKRRHADSGPRSGDSGRLAPRDPVARSASRGIDNVFTEWSGERDARRSGQAVRHASSPPIGAAGFRRGVRASGARFRRRRTRHAHDRRVQPRARAASPAPARRTLAAGGGFSCTMQISARLRP